MQKKLESSGNSRYPNSKIIHVGVGSKGIIKMKAVNIKLSLAENVKYFVNIANKYPYDLDLRVGRHVVDGKSILGIFSLDLSKPITLEVYSDHCDDLLEELKPFIIG